MRDVLGCLFGVIALPFIALTLLFLLFTWVLSRLIDPGRFRAITNGREFDYIGRWSTGDTLGIYGMFGAIAPGGVDGDVEVTIYYSRFQRFKRGELAERKFSVASSWDGIPVATKYGGEIHFSYAEGDPLIWFGWDEDGESARDGWFCSMRPGSYGSWKLTKRPRQSTDQVRKQAKLL